MFVEGNPRVVDEPRMLMFWFVVVEMILVESTKSPFWGFGISLRIRLVVNDICILYVLVNDSDVFLFLSEMKRPVVHIIINTFVSVC